MSDQAAAYQAQVSAKSASGAPGGLPRNSGANSQTRKKVLQSFLARSKQTDFSKPQIGTALSMTSKDTPQSIAGQKYRPGLVKRKGY